MYDVDVEDEEEVDRAAVEEREMREGKSGSQMAASGTQIREDVDAVTGVVNRGQTEVGDGIERVCMKKTVYTGLEGYGEEFKIKADLFAFTRNVFWATL